MGKGLVSMSRNMLASDEVCLLYFNLHSQAAETCFLRSSFLFGEWYTNMKMAETCILGSSFSYSLLFRETVWQHESHLSSLVKVCLKY